MKKKDRIIREWLNELPDGYREAALSEKPYYPWDVSKVDCMSEAILYFTVWEGSKFGKDFWSKCRSYFQTLENPLTPKLPELPAEHRMKFPIYDTENGKFKLDEHFTFNFEKTKSGYHVTWNLYYNGKKIAKSMAHTLVFANNVKARENLELFFKTIKTNPSDIEYSIECATNNIEYKGQEGYLWAISNKSLTCYVESEFRYSSYKTAKRGLDRFLKLFGYSIKDIKEYGVKK